MNTGLVENRAERRNSVEQSEHLSVRWKLAVKEQRKSVSTLQTELKPFRAEKDFLRNSETTALARFGEPVCSIMLFWPVDTSSSATTKGDGLEGRRETAFKQHILNVFFCCFHLQCCLSFELASCLWAMALTKLLLWSLVTLYLPCCHTHCKYITFST